VPRQRLLFFFPYVEEAARRRSLWQRFFHYRPANAPLVRQPFLRMEQERQARFALFRERMQPHLLQPLPETIEHALFIDFQPNGHPRALITARPWWSPLGILTPSVKRMLSNMERTLLPFVEKLRNT
jgi:hypothetical protein